MIMEICIDCSDDEHIDILNHDKIDDAGEKC